MQRRHLIQAAGAATLLGATPAWAQAYPSRVIRLVVPFAPGGPTDSFSRAYAEALGKQLGQTVVVDNKAGASGAIGSLEVKNSTPDGYTLLFGTASTHALYNLIEASPRYDAATDFDYVAALGGAPVAFAVSNAMPATLKAFFDASIAGPGKFNYGSPGTGTLLHVATERLLQLTGAQITHVPYKGSGPAMQDLMGGTIEMAVGTLGGMLPLHQGGKMRLVGVATAKRESMASEIPTVYESAGLAAPFEALLWNVVAVPRGTPEAIKATLADATKRAMSDPKVLASLAAQGMFADLHVGDAAASAFVKAEAAKWKPVIDKLGDKVKKS
jgi:tripartite-type tricarboxylate transporter receptor subunit TctC